MTDRRFATADGRTLGRDDILASPDMPVDYVDVPRWGGRVRVQAARVGSGPFVAYVNRRVKIQGQPGPGDEPTDQERSARRLVAAVIMSAIDEDGDPLFTWADADVLRDKHWNSVTKVATRAFELAGQDQINPAVEILGAAARIYNALDDKDREAWEPVLNQLADVMAAANEVWESLHPVGEDGVPIAQEVDVFAAGKGSSELDRTSGTSTPSA